MALGEGPSREGRDFDEQFQPASMPYNPPPGKPRSIAVHAISEV